MPGIVIIGIVIFVISFLIIFFRILHEYGTPIEFIDNFLIPIIMAALITLFGCLILGFAHSWATTPDIEPTASYTLIGMRDESCYGGHGYLRHFVLEKEPKYFFMYEDEYGMKQTTVKTDNCYIRFITGDQTPMLYVYNYEYASDYTKWLLNSPSEQMFVFFIPEESIITDNAYEINFE